LTRSTVNDLDRRQDEKFLDNAINAVIDERYTRSDAATHWNIDYAKLEDCENLSKAVKFVIDGKGSESDAARRYSIDVERVRHKVTKAKRDAYEEQVSYRDQFEETIDELERDKVILTRAVAKRKRVCPKDLTNRYTKWQQEHGKDSHPAASARLELAIRKTTDRDDDNTWAFQEVLQRIFDKIKQIATDHNVYRYTLVRKVADCLGKGEQGQAARSSTPCFPPGQ
jgi:hypothetical protein